MALTDTGLSCSHGHRFDRARQGYVNLAAGHGPPGVADTPAMVAARVAFLAGGYYQPIADEVARAVMVGVATDPHPLAVDLAGGTGWYLAALLDAWSAARGMTIDTSRAALRRAGRAHPRAAAVGSDAHGTLPLTDGCATCVLSIFGPRDPAEVRRILAPGGVFVVVSPRADHLCEIIGPLGLLSVDPRKSERQQAAFAAWDHRRRVPVTRRLALDHPALTAVASMGPSAWHVPAEVLAARIAALPATVDVSLSVNVDTFANR